MKEKIQKFRVQAGKKGFQLELFLQKSVFKTYLNAGISKMEVTGGETEIYVIDSLLERKIYSKSLKLDLEQI